jgi:hypothetical protein
MTTYASKKRMQNKKKAGSKAPKKKKGFFHPHKLLRFLTKKKAVLFDAFVFVF